jgi:hypothetical protein
MCQGRFQQARSRPERTKVSARPHRLPQPLGHALVLTAMDVQPAFSHGFGLRYDLPLPLPLYIWGAGATVALSFLAFALFLRHGSSIRTSIELRTGRFLCGIALLVRAIGVAIFALVIFAGFAGNQDPVRNIAPTMVWIIGWVGLAFLSMVLGNIWAVLNPWDSIFAFVEWAYAGLRRGDRLALERPYPPALATWPAVGLLIVFAWMELVWTGRVVPHDLACALLAYSGLTWAGMFVFGRAAWLRRGELFALVFGIFARFGVWGKVDCKHSVVLRVPVAGLLEHPPARFSTVMLVIGLLATVTFDGIIETPPWARLERAILDSAADTTFWFRLGLGDAAVVQAARTVAIVGCIALFVAAYWLVCGVAASLSGDRSINTLAVARMFVLTLVPIALAYHVAHYFSFLLLGGQYLIPLVSDPIGRGWDLFGTAHYRLNVGLVSPRLQWSVALVAVVVGHVIAVYLAHVTAIRMFGRGRSAIVTQIPMVLLMIGYTMASLWILSQPIVETGRG